VKALGPGEGAILVDLPGSEFTRRASRDFQWLEEYFGRLRCTETQIVDRRNQNEWSAGPLGQPEKCSRNQSKWRLSTAENPIVVHPTCYVSTHATFPRNGTRIPRSSKLLQQNELSSDQEVALKVLFSFWRKWGYALNEALQ